MEAAFDVGLVTSNAGAQLLGATDRAIRMMDRFASCFHDERRREYIQHEVATLVGHRVFGIALGYEDINDHDELRHDPMMAILAGKLAARREDRAPVAGKSTLNRLELSKLAPTRYHKISRDEAVPGADSRVRSTPFRRPARPELSSRRRMVEKDLSETCRVAPKIGIIRIKFSVHPENWKI